MTTSFPPGAGGSISLSATHWPLIHIRFEGQADDPTIDDHLEALSRVAHLHPGPRVVLVDATKCGYVSAYARRRHAEWMRAHEDLIRTATLGVAFALDTPLVRGALTAILWLEPLSCPYVVVRDAATGLARCRAWLEGRGLSFHSSPPISLE